MLATRIVTWIIKFSKGATFPGFDGLPLYDVTIFFYRGITGGYITSRAAAISYSVFLAIFPFLIFLFSIIPFIPVDNFQALLLDLIHEFLPEMAYETVKETIITIDSF